MPDTTLSTTVAASPTALRVGVDLCAASDVADAISRFGDRYLNAVYTPAELAYCGSCVEVRNQRLAARFAAKEATVKVLRPHDTGIDLRSIEIDRTSSGLCEIRLSGAAAMLARQANIRSVAVSMSHEYGMAAAVAIAEGTTTNAPATHQETVYEDAH